MTTTLPPVLAPPVGRLAPHDRPGPGILAWLERHRPTGEPRAILLEIVRGDVAPRREVREMAQIGGLPIVTLPLAALLAPRPARP